MPTMDDWMTNPAVWNSLMQQSQTGANGLVTQAANAVQGAQNSPNAQPTQNTSNQDSIDTPYSPNPTSATQSPYGPGADPAAIIRAMTQLNLLNQQTMQDPYQSMLVQQLIKNMMGGGTANQINGLLNQQGVGNNGYYGS